MPTSSWGQIPDVIAGVVGLAPRSVLEVGIGCGKYGVLIREYLDVWDHYFDSWGAHHARIEGVEVHALYASSPGWAAYDEVHIGDAREIIPRLGHFDCALMVDVLEHFEHAEGEALLRSLLDRCNAVVIAIPAVFAETVEVWDNPHEIHRAAWTVAEFSMLGSVDVLRESDSIVVVIHG